MRPIRNPGHQDWRTPPWLFRYLNTEYNFEVDAAARLDNKLCPFYFSPGLNSGTSLRTWHRALLNGHRRFFMNPPFNNIPEFLRMAWSATTTEPEAVVVCLLPARVEVAWAHEIVYPFAHEIRFVRGRVRYYRSSREGRPNFPSMVVVFGPGVRQGPLKVRTITR